MSLKKIISTASRKMRENESEGVDYYFMLKEKLLNLKDNNKLLLFSNFNDSLYGYEYKEFDDVDHLIVISGGSGTGKDTIFNSFLAEETSRFKDKNYKFLLCVPDTIPIFSDYAKEKEIQTSIIYLKVNEEERMNRILKGTMAENKKMVDRYSLNENQWFFSVDPDLDVTMFVIAEEFINPNEDQDILDVIQSAKDRVIRPAKVIINNLG